MAQPVFVDYYQALQMNISATTEQLRAAYIRLAKEAHPDKGGSVQAMRQLNQAYGTLRDPSLRKEYDVKYRKNVLGERLEDLSFTDNDDWDLDDVDEFLAEVYHQDERRRWMRPVFTVLAIAFAGVLLFVVFAVSRMTTTGGEGGVVHAAARETRK